jgi:hypothetical protein
LAKKVTASVAAGATVTQDVLLGATETLTVIAAVGPTATASGDVVVTVQPYTDEDRGSPSVLAPMALNAFDAVGPTLVAGQAWKLSQFKVAGYRRVQIQVKNNNVGALPVEFTFQLA